MSGQGMYWQSADNTHHPKKRKEVILTGWICGKWSSIHFSYPGFILISRKLQKHRREPWIQSTCKPASQSAFLKQRICLDALSWHFRYFPSVGNQSLVRFKLTVTPNGSQPFLTRMASCEHVSPISYIIYNWEVVGSTIKILLFLRVEFRSTSALLTEFIGFQCFLTLAV